MMNPPRPGKKLLVLDIDYSEHMHPLRGGRSSHSPLTYPILAIVDTIPLTSGALPPSECARPGLHDFLEAVYPYFDIVIWSQTSWIWLETKLVELGMVGSDKNYKVPEHSGTSDANWHFDGYYNANESKSRSLSLWIRRRCSLYSQLRRARLRNRNIR